MAIHTTYHTEKPISIDAIESVIKEKMGDKISFKQKTGGKGIIGKTIKGTSNDSVTVILNAYHRTVVTLQKNGDVDGKPNISIYFSEETLAGWLGFVHSNFGLIGAGIIRLIYGGGDSFYEDIQNHIKSNFEVKEEKLDTGIGQLFKKNRQ